jgi:hypothetical protein
MNQRSLHECYSCVHVYKAAFPSQSVLFVPGNIMLDWLLGKIRVMILAANPELKLLTTSELE